MFSVHAPPAAGILPGTDVDEVRADRCFDPDRIPNGVITMRCTGAALAPVFGF